MNKTELIAIAAENTGMTKKDTERVLNAAIDAITAALIRGEKVQLSGFGAFDVKDREPRPIKSGDLAAELIAEIRRMVEAR
jgi:DNA-binding protein HU-beta